MCLSQASTRRRVLAQSRLTHRVYYQAGRITQPISTRCLIFSSTLFPASGSRIYHLHYEDVRQTGISSPLQVIFRPAGRKMTCKTVPAVAG